MAPEILVATKEGSKNNRWADEFKRLGVEIQVWPDQVQDLSAVKLAVTMFQPPGVLQQLPNLEMVHGLGHGIDYIIRDADALPEHVSVLRIVDDTMAERMATWNLWAVLNCQRKCDEYLEAQRQREWAHGVVEAYSQADTGSFRVGIMGHGALGSKLAEVLHVNGYPVSIWARSPREDARFACFAGTDSLPEFLADLRVLICLLPLTAETRGIINADLLARLPRGAYFVNAGRGQEHVEADILAALDNGQLAGAVLDVFECEPLPQDSPLWQHPKVRIFPHVSSFTPLEAGVEQVLENWALHKQGKPIPAERQVILDRGY